MQGSIRRHHWLAVALLAASPAVSQISRPGAAPAQGPDAPRPNQTPTPSPSASPAPEGQLPAPSSDPAGNAPIIPESEFNAALPPLSGDINAPLEPMPADRGQTGTTQPTTNQPTTTQPATGTPPAPGGQVDTAIAPVGPEDPELAQPLVPLGQAETQPLQAVAEVEDEDAPEIRYDVELRGMEPLELDGQFNALSALREGDGKAANATQVQARAKEDEALAVRLMRSLGYYDATAIATVEQNPPVGPEGGRPGRLRAVVTATPGRLYTLSSVTIQAGPVTPPDLLTRNLPLKVGDPIEAARIQGAEANLNLVLPQQGYPFVDVGERDILLEDQAPDPVGAYTLPVDTGPRSSFGRLTSAGEPVFDLEHLNVFPRFDEGQLYDSRLTDDLRDALVATGLFSGIAVEPKRTGRTNPDGTEAVDLQVTQTRGPARTLAGQGGYSTGQGFTVEGSWTHRNLFPPEGALIVTGVAGTQQQGLSGTFRRQNAGRRDRTFTAIASAARNNYDAYEALTGTLSARWSYDSTPIWQKTLTYYYGVELIGTSEVAFDPTFDYFFGQGAERRRTYFIAALPGQVQFDQSDSLLNPTKGYRLRLNASPETSVRGGVRPYIRTMIEATGYFPVSDSLVIAGRARVGSIQGVDRDDLAPSRRYYGGGGGSVRGYGYQRLGPLDPNGNPLGGRSVNEFAVEARYRSGNFGIVPFIDAGNSYESSFPQGGDLRFGAGIGGRFYTNFGPFRIDVATPLNPREGDSKLALYLSIGQAF